MSGISSKRPVERDFYNGNVTLLIYTTIELHDAIYYSPFKSAGFLCPWLIIKYANVYRCLLKFVPIVRMIFVVGWNGVASIFRDLCCVFTRAASDPSSTRSTGAFYAVAIIYCNKTYNPLARPICRFELRAVIVSWILTRVWRIYRCSSFTTFLLALFVIEKLHLYITAYEVSI